MKETVLFFQTKRALNVFKHCVIGQLLDGTWENGPFYRDNKEEGVRTIEPGDPNYHPACPDGFSPDEIARLEVKVDSDYRKFGLWNGKGGWADCDLRKYGILDVNDLLLWNRHESGRDDDGCMTYSCAMMVYAVILSEKPALKFDFDDLRQMSHSDLKQSVLHEIYKGDVDKWDLLLFKTLNEINEALRTYNCFTRDEHDDRHVIHWKYFLHGGDSRWSAPWQEHFHDYSRPSINKAFEMWMLMGEMKG